MGLTQLAEDTSTSMGFIMSAAFIKETPAKPACYAFLYQAHPKPAVVPACFTFARLCCNFISSLRVRSHLSIVSWLRVMHITNLRICGWWKKCMPGYFISWNIIIIKTWMALPTPTSIIKTNIRVSETTVFIKIILPGQICQRTSLLNTWYGMYSNTRK